MPHVVAVELEMPDDLARFRLPPALDARLQRLLRPPGPRPAPFHR